MTVHRRTAGHLIPIRGRYPRTATRRAANDQSLKPRCVSWLGLRDGYTRQPSGCWDGVTEHGMAMSR